MRKGGWEAEFCAIRPATAKEDVSTSLSAHWDCIVIGGGIRILPANLEFFDTILNTVIHKAPGTPVAFNTQPENSAQAAARQLS